MAIKAKYGANEALKVIDGELTRELSIHRFDEKHEPRCICLPPMALWASNLRRIQRVSATGSWSKNWGEMR